MDVTQPDRIVARIIDVFPFRPRGFVLVFDEHHGPIPAGGRLWNGSRLVQYSGPDVIDTVAGDGRLCVMVAAEDLGQLAATKSIEFSLAPAAV